MTMDGTIVPLYFKGGKPQLSFLWLLMNDHNFLVIQFSFAREDT